MSNKQTPSKDFSQLKFTAFLQPPQKPTETHMAYEHRVESFIHQHPLSRPQGEWERNARISLAFPGDKAKFEDYLKAFPSAQWEIGGRTLTDMEMKEFITALRNKGSLHNSKLMNLLSAIMSEGDIDDPLVNKHEKDNYNRPKSFNSKEDMADNKLDQEQENTSPDEGPLSSNTWPPKLKPGQR